MISPPSTTWSDTTRPRPALPLVLEIGTPDWCWARLAATDEGMLVFEMPRRRVSLPVPYVVDQRTICVALAPIDTPAWQAAGGDAALVVTGTGHDDLRWLVRATGAAVRGGTRRLVLTSVGVRGCYETRSTDLASTGQP